MQPIYSLQPMPELPLRVVVESQIRTQIPAFQILGLASQVIQESKERVISSFSASGFEFPRRKVVTYLGPPEIPKTGSANDLAIAMSIRLHSIRNPPHPLYAWGELSPQGEVQPKGYMAQWCELLIDNPGTLFAHPDDITELEEILFWRAQHQMPTPTTARVVNCKTFKEAIDSFPNARPVLLHGHTGKGRLLKDQSPTDLPPLSPSLARWLLIALAGEHHWLTLGAKGVGKSTALLWAQCFAGPSTPEDTWLRMRQQIHWQENGLRPVRRIHSSARPTQLLGHFSKGTYIPGDLIRSHGGILFADEFPEWPRDTKEVLREPLEERRIVLTRRDGTIDLKCAFQWIGTGNLCPCGGSPSRFPPDPKSSRCRCSDTVVQRYIERLSGPVLDRLDLVTWINGSAPQTEEPIQFLKKLSTAREKIRLLFPRAPGNWSAKECEQFIQSTPNYDKTLAHFPHMSLRSRHKVIRVAATIAALDGQAKVETHHIHEAFHGRPESWLY
jgi:magnesium chelatase family protein